MRISITARQLEQNRRALERASGRDEKHTYFMGVAEARYVIRKVLRIVQEQAKNHGLYSLAHQALIQIYGSAGKRQQIKDIAERLDIAPAFASSLVKSLAGKKYVTRTRGGKDLRAIRVTVTKSGVDLLHKIDSAVQFHVDYFSRSLSPEQRGAAVSILLFYIGLAVEVPREARK